MIAALDTPHKIPSYAIRAVFDLQSPPPLQTSKTYLAEIMLLLANSDYDVVQFGDGCLLLARGVDHNVEDVAAAMSRVAQLFPMQTSP